jgi:hypothetical protein
VSKKTLIAAEQDTQRVKDLRFAYRFWSFTVDPRNLVFIDETEIHLGMTCLYGRAPVGQRLYDSEAPGDGGKNINSDLAAFWISQVRQRFEDNIESMLSRNLGVVLDEFESLKPDYRREPDL